MKFQSNNTYGNKSKRGKAKVTKEFKKRLEVLNDDVFEALKDGIEKRNSQTFQYVKLYFEYYYGKPKQMIDVVTETRNDFNIKDLYNSIGFYKTEETEEVE